MTDYLTAYLIGFVYKEIERASIPMIDTGDIPDAPPPREMIDLEVISKLIYIPLRERYQDKKTISCLILIIKIILHLLYYIHSLIY